MDPGGTTTQTTATDTCETVVVAGVRVQAGSVFARLDADLTDLTHGPLRPTDAATAADLTRMLEVFGRRLRGAQLLVMDQIDQASLHRADGHSTISIHTRHNTDVSNAEALNRTKTMRMMRGLPLIGAAVLDGSLSMDKAELLARVYANPRVAPSMADRQETFLEQADSMPFHAFEVRVRSWERMMDFDGSEPPNERTHRNRTAKLTQDQIDLSWEFVARFAAMQGAQINEIWGHYLDAEWQADWEKAVAEHGDKASVADVPRTHQQRAADALWQIFQDAAGADGSAVPPGFVHNIEWSEHTYAEMLRRLNGERPEPLDPDQHRCQTIDGVPLEPTEAAANSLLNAVRRVIVDAAGVTLDMGRKRFFTGALRDAINLASNGTCVWPGCCTPVTKCEADHLEPYGEGGLTNPGNGGPLCGKHNRWKQKGFTVQRHPDGTWTTTRPNGTTIK